ncbi:hypothetical protein IAT40_005927 [Kwoniella sp. CBS 6097]
MFSQYRNQYQSQYQHQHRRRSTTPPSATESTSTAPTTRSQSSTPDLDLEYGRGMMAGRSSRASTATTGTTTGTSGTSVTIWSDDQTEMPPASSTYEFPHALARRKSSPVDMIGGVKEGRLIDYDPPSDHDHDHDQDQDYRTRPIVSKGEKEMAPGDKLRELLRMMQQEVEISKPAPTPTPAPPSALPSNSGSSRNRRDWRRSITGIADEQDAEAEYGYDQEHEESIGTGPGADADPGPSSSSRESSPERRDRGLARGHIGQRQRSDVDVDEDHEEDEEAGEEESPPTPPPRIHNPYSARRGNRGRNSPILAQPGRLPSRAAVLLNSTSRSLSPEPGTRPSEPHQSPPTRLETFLASHSSVLPPLPTSTGTTTDINAEASTSRLAHPPSRSRSIGRRDSDSGSGYSIASSRKGKGREITPPVLVPANLGETSSSFTSRNRIRQRQHAEYPPSSPEPGPATQPRLMDDDYHTSMESQGVSRRKTRLPPTTPRRVSVDIAPDDSASFARNVGGLEVRAEMELDLDEGFSRIGWSETSESVADVINEDIDIEIERKRDREQDARAEVELDHVEERTASLTRSISLDEEGRTQLQNRRERSMTARLPQVNTPSRSRRRGSSPERIPSPPRPKSADPSTSFNSSLRTSQRRRQTPPKPKPKDRSSSYGDYVDQPSLPALPEPDLSKLTDDEGDEVDTYSSRRAALFRSTSASRSGSIPKSTSLSDSKHRSTTHSTLSAVPSRSREDEGEDGDEDELSQQTKSGSYRTDIGSKSRLSRHSMETSPQSNGYIIRKRDTDGEVQAPEEEIGVKDSPFVKNRMLPRRSPQPPSLTSPSTPHLAATKEEHNLISSAHLAPEHATSSLQASSLRRRSPVISTTNTTDQPSPLRIQQAQSQSQFSASSLDIAPQAPIRVGIALTPHTTLDPSTAMASTPLRSTGGGGGGGSGNTSIAPTPKPPGAWQYTPKGKVRFTPSPLGKGSPLRASTSGDRSLQAMDGSVSIHRLKLSPRREKIKAGAESISTTGDKGAEGAEAEDIDGEAETSFIGRLKESLGGSLSSTKDRIPIPRPSTTFTQAISTLHSAQSKTLSTQQQLETTQRQWLEALSALNTAMSASKGAKDLGLGVGVVVRQGWSWGTWAWWVLLEVVVLWSVFRVTLDYATSISHLTSLDPFHPLALPFRQLPAASLLSSSGLGSASASSTWGIGPFGPSNPISLTIPIPSALQRLVGRQGMVNFFDLVEGWDFWRMLIGSGIVSGGLGDVAVAGAGAGAGSVSAAAAGRMLGGVPS